MHRSHFPKRSTSLARFGFTVLAATALVVAGTASTVTAAPRTGGPTSRADDAAVTPVCADPKPGQFACFALRRTDVRATTGVVPDSDPSGYGPADLHSAYNLPAGGGAGQTVAIVDAYDDPKAEADLAVYRAQYGLPACTTANGCFRKVDQRGGTDYPAPNSGWAGEIALDVDMVSAAAPDAHILLVEADSAYPYDLGASVNTAVSLGAKFVSNSYGSRYAINPEDPGELTYEEQYYNHPGVAITASSGDSSYGVSFPAASQYVTSVGGTALHKDTSTTRGWSESVWDSNGGGPGSGCSQYEPKPAFQKDTGCDNRAIADVSAVADPVTGVAVYSTYGDSGWGVWGGTSAAAPIIAGVYADAGTPDADSYPNADPYQAGTSTLNDVTSGSNGTCSPTYLCTAGVGYDGPTGLGTPNGLAGFRSGPHGVVSGVVTDAAGAPIRGARVSVGDATATTDDSGAYTVTVEPGTYDVTAAAYAYTSRTVTGVAVGDGGTVSENFALDAVERAAVTGTVTDGSGHDWPLYAAITVDGVPGGPAYTNPYTGRYEIDLPTGHDYTLHVAPIEPGYSPADRRVSLATADVTANIAAHVDATTCIAPGYGTGTYDGTPVGFDTDTVPDGWSVTSAAGTSPPWSFTDPADWGNKTGGTGGYAIVDSHNGGNGGKQDTSLVSPVVDMSDQNSPVIGFDTYYWGTGGETGDVDVSTDGGANWTTLWEHTTGATDIDGHVEIPLPAAAGQSDVRVRFHFTAGFGWLWELDNVYVGNKTCATTHGGLVAGQVSDTNTGDGVWAANVANADAPGDTANTGDPNLGDGFYWLFSTRTGSHPFTAAKGGYTSQSRSVEVAANYVTRADFALKAGQVTVNKSSINNTIGWGGQATPRFTVTNTGKAPANVDLIERPGDFQSQGKGNGAAPVAVHAATTDRSYYDSSGRITSSTGTAPADNTPAAAGGWTSLPNTPSAIQDSAVAVHDGKVYSVDGYTGHSDTNALYSYDPATGSWSQLTSAADRREGEPAHGIVGDKLYIFGGWGTGGAPDTKVEIYDFATDSWTTGTAAPVAYGAAGSAVLDGRIYSVGGCTISACGSTAVEVYNPATDSWSTAADYPENVSWESCGAISGKLYCAGGETGTSATKHSYAYDPDADSWTRVADMPVDAWGSAYTAANGLLLVSGGAINDSAVITNTGYAFDPKANTWSPLPNTERALYRTGGAPGFYGIGGNPGGLYTPPVDTAALLGGYDQGTGTDASWLTESATKFTLAPGASRTVTLTLDAGDPTVSQPGVYSAAVRISTDTPYRVPPVAVTMTVKPPKTWGKVTGTVLGTGEAGTADPIACATVQIDSWAQSYTLKTDKDGHFSLWLDKRNNPATVIFAKDGFAPTVRTVTIKAGGTVTVNVTLRAG